MQNATQCAWMHKGGERSAACGCVPEAEGQTAVARDGTEQESSAGSPGDPWLDPKGLQLLGSSHKTFGSSSHPAAGAWHAPAAARPGGSISSCRACQDSHSRDSTTGEKGTKIHVFTFSFLCTQLISA